VPLPTLTMLDNSSMGSWKAKPIHEIFVSLLMLIRCFTKIIAQNSCRWRMWYWSVCYVLNWSHSTQAVRCTVLHTGFRIEKDRTQRRTGR
jgi:hypothetical protein